jgi:hypothetical protein
MSGFEDALEIDPQVLARKGRMPAGDTRPAPSLWEGTAAAFRAARDDQPTHIDEERNDAYAAIANALQERGKPHSRYWQDGVRAGAVINIGVIWSDVQAERAKDPKAFAELPKTQSEFEDKWRADMRQRQARDAETVSRSGWVPWLAGGAAGAMTDPINVGSMAITGGGSLLVSAARSALINGAVEAVEQPLVNVERQRQGRPELTLGERAAGVGLAMAGGAALDVGGRIVGAGIGAAADRINPLDRRMARALAAQELDKASPADIIARFDASVPEHLRTPDQQAARDVFERAAEIDETSPFARTHEATAAHQSRVDEALARLVQGATGPTRPRPAASAAAGGGDGIEAYLAAARRQESSGNANARNPRSSASGLYQFTDSTWVATYKAVFPGSGLSNPAILARKSNVDLQDRLMRRFTEANGQWLQRNGFQADPGNLYVVHHLGQGGANTVLRAAPDMPLERLLSADVIKANPHMRGMSAGEFRAWAAERMGQRGGASEAPSARVMADEEPAIRPADEAAMMAERPAVRADGESIDPAMLDNLDGLDAPAPAAPLLLREQFADDAAWRLAQARVDAEALGLDAPEMTWRDVLPEEQAAAANGLSEARMAAERDMNAAIEQGRAMTVEALQGPEGLAAMKAADLAVVKWRLAQMDELEAARAALESEADRAGGFSMGAPTAYRFAANEMGFHPLTREEIAATRADLAAKVERGGAASPADIAMAVRMRGGEVSVGKGAVADAMPEPAIPQAVRNAAGGEAELYADPASADMVLQADRLWHDLENALGGDVEGDAKLYTLGEGDQRTIAQVKDEHAAEVAAINAVRGCL